MRARDVMVSPVITVKAADTVKAAAQLMLAKGISALPVMDDKDRLVGLISEGDLLHRAEADTERRRPWWLQALTTRDELAADFVKSHGRLVSDVMTRRVISAAPDAPLHEIAALMEKNGIKRVPILAAGKLVGIVSRANLIQAVATDRAVIEVSVSDATLRQALLDRFRTEPWSNAAMLNVTVNGGIVSLWGFVESESERKAIHVAAETTAGVRAIVDNLNARPPFPIV